MALKIIQGKIGAGKTYFAVHHVWKNYAVWDDELDSWKLKENIEVYSNIDGFKLGGSLDMAIEDAGGLGVFFTKDYQFKFAQGKRVIYIIDEAQSSKFFHRKFYNAPVFDFIQYSRHYGIDIYMITQDVWSMCKEMRELPEHFIEPVRRSKALLNEFRYRFTYEDGECFKTKTLKREKAVFSLYRSAMQGEVESVPSSARRYLVLFGVLLLISFLGLKFIISDLFGVKAAEAKKLESGGKNVLSLNSAGRVVSQEPKKLNQTHYVSPVHEFRKPPVASRKKVSQTPQPVIRPMFPSVAFPPPSPNLSASGSSVFSPSPFTSSFRLTGLGSGGSGDGSYVVIDGLGIMDITAFNSRFNKSAVLENDRLCYDGQCYSLGDKLRLM